MIQGQADKAPVFLVGAIILLSIAVFVVDLMLPLGVADGVLYVAPVALSLWLPGRRHTLQVAIAGVFLTLLGFFLSPPGNELPVFVVLNRVYSLIAIGMIVLIDRLQSQLVHRNSELASQTVTLEALYEIGMGLSALLDAETIKETAVQRARKLFASDAAGLAILDESTGELRWHRLAGIDFDNVDFQNIDLQLGQGVIGRVVQSGESMMVKDAQAEQGSEDLAAISSILGESVLRAALVVPVRIAGKPIGALMVGYQTPRSFNLADIKLLSGLANQVAVAINNAQLFEQLSALSVLEERQRLAREMHDGLAQLLGGITARATATSELLGQGKTQDAQTQLARLHEVALRAYAEVRQSILGLRTPSPKFRGLIEALSEYVDLINDQHQIPVRLENPVGAQLHHLAPNVEVQAIRIVQEAINNVQKHSRANAASVNISGNGDWLTIKVQDDGVGFAIDSSVDRGGHFGLQMMRERAESVGGHLEIETEPGKGALLVVRLPVEMGR